MGSLTVCNSLLLWEVEYDGFAWSLWVWSRVSMLLELLLCHQVCPQLPVQCGSYSETQQQVKQMSLNNGVYKTYTEKQGQKMETDVDLYNFLNFSGICTLLKNLFFWWLSAFILYIWTKNICTFYSMQKQDCYFSLTAFEGNDRLSLFCVIARRLHNITRLILNYRRMSRIGGRSGTKQTDHTECLNSVLACHYFLLFTPATLLAG